MICVKNSVFITHFCVSDDGVWSVHVSIVGLYTWAQCPTRLVHVTVVCAFLISRVSVCSAVRALCVSDRAPTYLCGRVCAILSRVQANGLRQFLLVLSKG